MRKMRNALFGMICLTGMLTACGESPIAPHADVPLAGAEAKKQTSETDNEATTTDTTNIKKAGPVQEMSGYVLGMD